MIKIYVILVSLVLTQIAQAQIDSIVIPESQTLDLQFLVIEAMLNNPEIRALLYQMDVMEAKVPQASAVDDPELRFMQEGMPDFNFSSAMFSRLELMQRVPFPTKLAARKDLAKILAEHAHHDHLEKVNEVVANLKSAFSELWFAQQTIVLDRESARLMGQFHKIAGIKYGVGSVPQQDVLKAQVELLMIENELISFRQRELSAKAMLMSILDRAQKDTLGFAFIPEEVMFDLNLDTLLALALHIRPMVIHDSLGVAEASTMLALSKQEYLPDFQFGLERMISPLDGFKGWSISAGINIPLAPWTLGKASARVEEASAGINRASAQYQATKAMVVGSVKDLYYKAQAAKRRLDTYRVAILPQAQQSVNASLIAYQTGQTDFLMLIDSYRTNVNLRKEYYMTRMQFDQTVAELDRQVGTQNFTSVR